MPSAVQIRAATLDDAALIAGLTRAAWAGRVAATSSGHREDEERVLRDLRAGGGFLLLQDNRAIGSVRWSQVESELKVWEIMRMGILPAYRGQDLSRHLLEAVFHHARTAGITELRLAVRADQPRLLRFYAAFGFAETPDLAYTRANPAEPAPIVMRRILRQQGQ